MRAQSLLQTIQQSDNSSVTRLLIDGVCLLLIIVPALFVSAVNLHVSYDDAFITYRYAYNLAIGQGFVYNPGEWFMGTTAPLYGLILGVLGFIFGADAIPTLSGYLSGLSLLMSGIGLYVYGRLHGQPFCGLLAGVFFVSNRLLPLTFGGEMLFQIALILWAFVCYQGGRTRIAAFLLGCAILTRMDSLVAVGVIGLHYLWVHRRLPWQEMLITTLVLLPFAGLSFVYYGSLLPATLDAKIAQRDSGLWPPFFGGLVEWIRAFTIQGSSSLFQTLPAAPNAIRFIGFVALGVPALLLWFRFWLLPLAWVTLFVLAYSILNVPFYHWYVVPVALGLMILAACGVAGVVRVLIDLVTRFRSAQTARLFAGGFAVLIMLLLTPGIVAQLQQTRDFAGPNPVEILYERTGHWFREHTPPGSSIGYFEIGRVGYYAERTLIDPLGLVNPAFHPAVARGDLIWAYEQTRPDYIVYNKHFAGWFAPMLQQRWFTQEYRETAQVELPGFHSLTVFERVDSAEARK